jgi:3'-phosphoadenosine 5'-phosphosulfate sulfotransferase (PAPS reductase)/FAD synthetase
MTKVVNCMGIRAEESPNRAQGLDKPCFETSGQAVAFATDKKLSTKGCVGFTWYPIFEMTSEQVFDTIRDAGQEPHEAYSKYGMSRLSCVFCVMASKGDLQIAAARAPELLNEYVALETEINKTVFSIRRNKQAVLISMRDYLARPLMRSPKKLWKWANSVAKWSKAS